MTRIVVVGNGMVGSRFATDVLLADTDGRHTLTVLGEEGVAPYNRVLLSDVVAGRRAITDIELPQPPHERLVVHEGEHVTSIDRLDRVVTTSSGARHRFDFLVLATGARARIPDVPGIRSASGRPPVGVHALRDLTDATAIIRAAGHARRAVVLGGGVLGVEVATGLRTRGLEVTLVHTGHELMERQLGSRAADVLGNALSRLGVEHQLGTTVDAVVHDGSASAEEPRLSGVRLSSGEILAADLLVVTAGTTPSTDLAERAGLECRRGVVVDDASRTTDPRVFAIGDCAEPPSGAAGLLAQGWGQASALAALLTTRRPVVTAASSAAPSSSPDDVVRVKAHGIDVVSMGLTRPSPGSARAITLSDPDAGRHLEIVVSGDRLVGATCIGDPDVATDLVVAYTRATPLPVDPARLLLRPLPTMTQVTDVADLPDEGLVCRCSSVTKGSITAAIHQGCTSVEEVAQQTRATTGCGSCREDVCSLVETLAATPDLTALPDRG